MENKTGRGTRNIAIAAVLLAIIGMTIGFAALSQTLTIGGVATVRQASWDITFANLSTPTLTGEAAVVTPAALVSSGTTMNFAVSLKQPNDSVVYEVDMVNNGSINARVSSVSLTGVSDAVAANVTYTLTYANGDPINVNDTLNAGQTRRVRLTVSYNAVTTLPSADIPLNLGATIVFVQN